MMGAFVLLRMHQFENPQPSTAAMVKQVVGPTRCYL